MLLPQIGQLAMEKCLDAGAVAAQMHFSSQSAPPLRQATDLDKAHSMLEETAWPGKVVARDEQMDGIATFLTRALKGNRLLCLNLAWACSASDHAYSPVVQTNQATKVVRGCLMA